MRFIDTWRALRSIVGRINPLTKQIVKFDLSRHEAESKMEMGTGLPEQFASILRPHNAGSPRQEKSLVAATSQKNLRRR